MLAARFGEGAYPLHQIEGFIAALFADRLAEQVAQQANINAQITSQF
jgi:uncharacterized protein involved in cysteine biosynthesis